MPRLRCLDSGAGHPDTKRNSQRQTSALRVRESTQVRHDGIRRRANWPFFYIIEEGRTYINLAPRRRTAGAKDYEEEARW